VSLIDRQQVPFTVLGDQWIGFDDNNSLTVKVGTIATSRTLHVAYIMYLTLRCQVSTWMGDRLCAAKHIGM